MKSRWIRIAVLLAMLLAVALALGEGKASCLHAGQENGAWNLRAQSEHFLSATVMSRKLELQVPRQCPGAPFVVPAEYVHASYGVSWFHPGVDFTGRTTDPDRARQPISLACPGNGGWDLGAPGEAPVYAAYGGFVDGFHYADGVLIGIYIRHENVTVNGQTYPVVCTYYEHMANASTGETTIFPQFRTWNAPVQQGEQIGWIGNKRPGGSTFAHLHFGVGIGLYGSHCNRPYESQWYTDPSPFLGFNVNQENGAPRYCYTVDCPSDVTPPNTSMTSGPSGCIGINDVTFGWTGSDNQTPTSSLQYRYRLDGHFDWSGWTGDTSRTYENLPDGSHTFRVKARDEVGNEDPSPAIRSFQVDTRAPSNPTLVQSNCGAQNNLWQNSCNEPDFTWSGASDHGGCAGIGEYGYRWQMESGTVIESGTTSPASFSPRDPVSDGVYKLRLRTKDTLGHWSGWTDAFVLRYDSTAPTTTLQINRGASTTNQTTVHLNLSANDTGSGVADVRISDNGLIWSDWRSFADTIPWTLPALNRRTLPVYVQARDHASNESTIVSDTITLELHPPMPHSDNYRICADVVDTGGSVGIASSSYSLVSAIGQPWTTGANANTSTRFGEQAGFLANITGCLPISYTVTSNYTVTQWVVASGGNLRGSVSYRMGDTAGQPAASENNAFTSASYVLSSGFWAQVTGTVPPTTTQPTPVPITPTPTPTPSPTPTPQPDGFGVRINDGDLYTNDPVVTVRTWAPNVTHMRLSNDGGYSDEDWRTYRATTTWVLSTYGEYLMPRYVYAWFRDPQASVYGPFFDDIIHDPVAPEGRVRILGSEVATVTLWLESWDDNSGVDQMRVGENIGMRGAAWQPYTDTVTWVLQNDVVYAQFQDRAGNASLVYGSDGSTHDTTTQRYIYLPLVLRNG